MSDLDLITITESAQRKIETIFSDEENKMKGLRLGVIGGGCSGLQYQMEFSVPTEKDRIIDYSSFKVLLDPKSTIYLKGIVLDYEDGLKGKGFVFKNPNATNTCGCGESFSV